MEKNKELGIKLKELREAAFPGMGLRRASLQIGIDYTHLFRLEAGQYIPTDENLLKLLNAYGVNNPKDRLGIFNLVKLFSPIYSQVVEDASNSTTPHEFTSAFNRKKKMQSPKQDNITGP